MGHTRTRIGAHVVQAATAALLLLGGSATGQDVTEPALKAAFIYNFAKFTEWPADVAPAGEPLRMCVVGDSGVEEALERIVKGRVLAGHSIIVTGAVPAGTQPGCNLLYLSGVSAARAAQLLAGSRGALTISDLDGFSALGGIAQFFFEQGRLRFSVHMEPAERARLHISSRLLALAVPR